MPDWRWTWPAASAIKPIEGSLNVEKNTVISGYRRSKGWAADHTYFFVAEFSRPFDAVGRIDVRRQAGWPDTAIAKARASRVHGARFDFKMPASRCW